ncbi:MAG: phosphate ABC transporter substrate-binding protein, partial [Mesorhizobium sp.]|nr:phosphate ABC transporter substrate-binding protein [Mesorhizobium sp.]
MSELVAALPMYDWPEMRGEVDAQWALLREAFRQKGIDAPQSIVRRNGDLLPVPGGIRDAGGDLIAPDPAVLPPDELDFHKLWLH